MNAVMPVTIALVMAVVAGAFVWLVWSVLENFAARRRAKTQSAPSGAESSENSKSSS